MTNHVTRYVITHINRDGMRTLSDPAQGRFTYESEDEARKRMRFITHNTSSDALTQVFGPRCIGTFEVRACECFAAHHDPVSVWFD